jgi:hypothetical protein
MASSKPATTMGRRKREPRLISHHAQRVRLHLPRHFAGCHWAPVGIDGHLRLGGNFDAFHAKVFDRLILNFSVEISYRIIYQSDLAEFSECEHIQAAIAERHAAIQTKVAPDVRHIGHDHRISRVTDFLATIHFQCD